MTVIYPRFEGTPVVPESRTHFLNALRAILRGHETLTGSYLNATKAAVLRENLPMHHNARTDETFAHSSQLTDAFFTNVVTGLTQKKLESLYGDYGCDGATPWIKSRQAMNTVRLGIQALGTKEDVAQFILWVRDTKAFWNKGSVKPAKPAAPALDIAA